MIQKDEYENYSLDDWIDLFKKKIEELDSDDETKKYQDAIQLLTDVKENNHIVSNGDEINDDLIVHIKLISDTFSNIFGSFEYQIDMMGNVIVMYNNIISIDLYVKNNRVHSLIAFGYNTDVRIVAEATRIICDLFGPNFEISDNVYYINGLTNEFIWGKKNIITHLNRTRAYTKVNPIVYFDDEERGNC
jgi:hypothetical protein